LPAQGLPDDIQNRNAWQHAAARMLVSAAGGGDVEAATTQIELALFLMGWLDLRGV
jgi:hypothetical protein